MVRLVFRVISSFAVLFWASTVAAQDAKNPEPFDLTMRSGDLLLVTGNDFPPFADKSLAGGGMVTEVPPDAPHNSDVGPSLAHDPWTRGRILTLYGNYDATFPYIRTLEREALFYFSDPVYVMDVNWYLRSDSDIENVTEETVSGARVCKPDGYYLSDIQDFLINRVIELEFRASLEECLVALKNGEVELVSGGAPVVAGIIDATPRLSEADFRSIESGETVGLHVMVSKFHPNGLNIMSRIDDAIDRLGVQRQAEIQRKHLDSATTGGDR